MPFQEHFQSLPLQSVRLTDPFWSHYQKELVEKGLLAQYEQLVKTDRIKNFQRVAAGEKGGFEGFRFNDSDVYKWLEACAFALSPTVGGNNPGFSALKAKVDEVVEVIARAQMLDGYLNTFFQLNEPDFRWRNLSMMHEMYCAGHLIEAGVAMFDATGDRKLLEVCVRFADHIDARFGPGKTIGYCGHEEIELALLKLARATGDSKYRELAKWMVEVRGSRPSPFKAEMKDPEAVRLNQWMEKMLCKDGEYSGEYLQDHAPIRDHETVVGHAVRAMYLYIAAAELAMGADDERLEAALVKTWQSLTHKRMYVTGGIGPSGDNEGFTFDYDLPNLSAYAETCASIGLVFWANKMLAATGDSEYADTLERALYNGALAGISRDTTMYFYDNPLESRGRHARTPWFGCACCPPNIARMIAGLGKYTVGASDKSFWIHVPVGFQASTTLNGVEVELEMKSNYPWSGDFELFVNPAKPVEFELRFRIPDWADDVETDIPGLESEAEYDRGYIVVKKRWSAGDKATIRFEIKPRWVTANPQVMDDLGRAALVVGPIVYAAEEKDCGFKPQFFSADTDAEFLEAMHSELKMPAFKVEGVCESDDYPDQLYGTLDDLTSSAATATFIPYFAWNNRGPNAMQVWVRKL